MLESIKMAPLQRHNETTNDEGPATALDTTSIPLSSRVNSHNNRNENSSPSNDLKKTDGDSADGMTGYVDSCLSYLDSFMIRFSRLRTMNVFLIFFLPNSCGLACFHMIF